MSLDLSPSAPAIWRQNLSWEVDLWFCLYKPHDDQCTCQECKEALDHFIEVDARHRTQHDEGCDCDYCEPFSSFCTCEKCIPEQPTKTVVFQEPEYSWEDGTYVTKSSFQIPLACPPHCAECECYGRAKTDQAHDNYLEDYDEEEEERRIKRREESMKAMWD